MLLIISGTNRPDSATELIATHLYELLKEIQPEAVGLLKLTDLPNGWEAQSSKYKGKDIDPEAEGDSG